MPYLERSENHPSQMRSSDTDLWFAAGGTEDVGQVGEGLVGERVGVHGEGRGRWRGEGEGLAALGQGRALAGT